MFCLCDGCCYPPHLWHTTLALGVIGLEEGERNWPVQLVVANAGHPGLVLLHVNTASARGQHTPPHAVPHTTLYLCDWCNLVEELVPLAGNTISICEQNKAKQSSVRTVC